MLMKVETHNHPTAISPLPGRGDRLGRRDPRRGRDRPRRQAQGRPRAASPSPTCASPAPSGRGRATTASPDRIASPLAIMIEGPIGAAVVQQRVRPAEPRRLLPHLRAAGRRRRARLPQADHDRRRPRQRPRRARAQGRHPAGRRSSSARRPGHAHRPRRRRGLLHGHRRERRGPRLRLRAARQRRDPAPRQEVIDRCWALGEREPDPLDPRRRRRRPLERAARARPRQRARRDVRPARRSRTRSPA